VAVAAEACSVRTLAQKQARGHLAATEQTIWSTTPRALNGTSSSLTRSAMKIACTQHETGHSRTAGREQHPIACYDLQNPDLCLGIKQNQPEQWSVNGLQDCEVVGDGSWQPRVMVLPRERSCIAEDIH